MLPADDSQPHDDGTPPPPASRPTRPLGDCKSISTRAFEDRKLEPTWGPGVFLVIDHVERPNEN